jgi:hypothetical protein
VYHASDSALRTTSDESPALELQHMDQRTVALHLPIGPKTQLLKGRGRFVRDPKLGDLLRIACHDDAGSFDLLIKQSEWNGAVRSGESFGCDYFIRLDAGS